MIPNQIEKPKTSFGRVRWIPGYWYYFKVILNTFDQEIAFKKNEMLEVFKLKLKFLLTVRIRVHPFKNLLYIHKRLSTYEYQL